MAAGVTPRRSVRHLASRRLGTQKPATLVTATQSPILADTPQRRTAGRPSPDPGPALAVIAATRRTLPVIGKLRPGLKASAARPK